MSEIELAGSRPEVISQLLARKDLSASHAGAAMRSVLSGEATPSQITAFIVALRAKGETEIELEGMLAEVRRAAERVFLPDEISQRALDIVGTGGDHSHSVNVSTMAGLVVAGAKIPVCKHGSRASSSKSGAADVLEALGVASGLWKYSRVVDGPRTMSSPISPRGSSLASVSDGVEPSVISMIFTSMPGNVRPTQVPAPCRDLGAVCSSTSRPQIEAIGSDSVAP